MANISTCSYSFCLQTLGCLLLSLLQGCRQVLTCSAASLAWETAILSARFALVGRGHTAVTLQATQEALAQHQTPHVVCIVVKLSQISRTWGSMLLVRQMRSPCMLTIGSTAAGWS